MSIGLRKKLYLRAAPIVIALIAALALGAGSAYADPHNKNKPPKYGPKHGKVVVVHRKPNYGRAVVALPPKHHVVHVHGDEYYYHGGDFYRRGPSGFITVRAPIGAVVINLPLGFRTFFVAGTPYYYYGDVYYRKGPSGYVVVAPPPNIEIIEQSDAVPATPGMKIAVTAQLLNVRSGPSLGYDVVSQIRQGSVLEVLAQEGNWLYVKTGSGYYGWVMANYTVPISQPASG